MDRLTVSAWAKTVGISKQAGYKAVRRCGIPIVDGKVDPDVATTLYRKRTRARANERRPDGDGATAAGVARVASEEGAGDYLASRSRRERAEADLAELKLLELRGELVRAAAVRAAAAKRYAQLRDSLLQLPARVVPLLLANHDASSMDKILRVEVVAALHALTSEAE